MTYHAMEDHRQRDSSDGDAEWKSSNIRIGGYKFLKAAIKAITNKAHNGHVLNDSRQIVAVIKEGKVIYP